MRMLYLLLLAGLSVVLAACGGSQPQQVAPTDAPVTITLTTDPDPPTIGEVTILFTVIDNQGLPVTGADFAVTADHADMGGMTLNGKATEQKTGEYVITADFSMSGNWLLTVQVRNETLDYKKDIPFVIK